MSKMGTPKTAGCTSLPEALRGVELSRDNDGVWTLTRAVGSDCAVDCLCCLQIDASGSWDWHTFTAGVFDADGYQVLGTFEIAPSELLSATSSSWDSDVTPWDPLEEDDFGQIRTYRLEFVHLVRVWGSLLDIVGPAAAHAPDDETMS